MKKNRLANEPVTQATLDRLPLLLRASEVKWATGWTDAELAAEVAAGHITAVANALKSQRRKNGRRVACKTNYKKYTKASVARRIGLKS